MTDLLFHTAPAAARELRSRLTVLLEQLPRDERERLQAMLVVEEHERPRMVLTGQYSSGKSTLIKALTDEAAEVIVDSAVATDTVDVFDWDGLVDLVDTPGVQAGVWEHDELAENALRSADLVLFAVSVDLFDDRSVAHLRHITDELRKAPQLLVVITKSRTLAAADGVREAAVRDALGPFADQVPWVECDAKTYVDGLHEVDPSQAARRIAASRMGEVTEAINQIARDRGDLARFRVPLQQLALVAADALTGVTRDPNDAAVLGVLARQRAALTNRRGLVDSALDRRATEFRNACIRAAERLADEVESIEESPQPEWSALEAASETLNEDLNSANDQFEAQVGAVLESQLAEFTSEVREIEASPYAQRLRTLEIDVESGPQNVWVNAAGVRGPGRDRTARPEWADGITKHLAKFQKAWGAGDGVKKSAGSAGHKIIYDAGKRIGINFKPYQAVRWADNVGRVAKAGSAVLPVALEAYAVVHEERAEAAAIKEKHRRRNALIGRVLVQSDGIAQTKLQDVRHALDAEFGAALRDIDNLNQAVHDGQTFRDALSRDLSAVQSEAEALLDRLGGLR